MIMDKKYMVTPNNQVLMKFSVEHKVEKPKENIDYIYLVLGGFIIEGIKILSQKCSDKYIDLQFKKMEKLSPSVCFDNFEEAIKFAEKRSNLYIEDKKRRYLNKYFIKDIYENS